MKTRLFCLTLALFLANCAQAAESDPGYGKNPQLPEPEHNLIPTVNVAPAKSWPAGQTPKAPQEFTVSAYATGFDHPRWLYVLPNGDVLVAETDAPAKPDDNSGIEGMVMKHEMKKAGSGRKSSADRITILHGIDETGHAQTKKVFLQNLHSPFGMTLVGNDLYVADTDALLKFPYHEGDTEITVPGVKVADLPAGTINHHWTKNVVASPDGKKLYVSVGSNSNVGENGIEAEKDRADILEIDPATGKSRVYAFGLRNPVGMDFQPDTKILWAAVNERDELGNNLVPDYMTSVKEGAFYGWPYSYYGNHVDDRMKPQRPDLLAKAIPPDYALGNHTASLGLVFYTGDMFPAHYKNGAFVGQHGSWNRNPKSGYRVVFVPFSGGTPSGMPEDFLTGFLDDEDNARGRPVGVAVAKDGALLVADDVGNTVWRVITNQTK